MLKYWKQILSTASTLERSLRKGNGRGRGGGGGGGSEVMTEYSLLSRSLNVNEVVVRDRVEEVNELIKDIEEILKERCSLLLNDLEPVE